MHLKVWMHSSCSVFLGGKCERLRALHVAYVLAANVVRRIQRTVACEPERPAVIFGNTFFGPGAQLKCISDVPTNARCDQQPATIMQAQLFGYYGNNCSQYLRFVPAYIPRAGWQTRRPANKRFSGTRHTHKHTCDLTVKSTVIIALNILFKCGISISSRLENGDHVQTCAPVAVCMCARVCGTILLHAAYGSYLIYNTATACKQITITLRVYPATICACACVCVPDTKPAANENKYRIYDAYDTRMSII